VRGPDTSGLTQAFRVEDSNGTSGLTIWGDRAVQIGRLLGSTTTHACVDASLDFAACSSAAEYVPTVDAGLGAPEATDLVSMAPTTTNPYGDEHSPFVVTKSGASCDPNLLGFLLNPASGADGTKVNDHYLPLAIYGYFPAKVTMEGSAIRRGDAITSSSTPGAGMKATGACKTIGYALEDADEDGTIQVFAHLSENAASGVADLQAQMQQKDERIGALEQQNASLESRLAAIEQRLNGGTVPLVAMR
jgi:hypothetical protein